METDYNLETSETDIKPTIKSLRDAKT